MSGFVVNGRSVWWLLLGFTFIKVAYDGAFG